MVRPGLVSACWARWSNFPQRYIKREREKLRPSWWYKSNPQAAGQPERLSRWPYRYAEYQPYLTDHPPWSSEARKLDLYQFNHLKHKIRPIRAQDWPIFRGDLVQILEGGDAGKQGTVDRVFRARNWVYVKFLNLRYSLEGGHTQETKGTSLCVAREQPLLFPDQVQLVDPEDGLPCTTEFRYTQRGERVRVSTRTGRIVPESVLAEETRDYKTKGSYEEQPKDTPADEASKATFSPKLSTFRQDIEEEMGITDARRSQWPTFWY